MEPQSRKTGLFLILALFSISLIIGIAMASAFSSVLNDESRFEVNDRNQHITIHSDLLEGDTRKNIVRFTGNVVAKRGDVTICADSVAVLYDKTKKDVREIIAEGNVNITQRDRIATGEKAFFVNSEDTIILTGHPRLREGNNEISGGKITLFLAEDRGVVEGDGETRVNATIHTEKKEGEKRD